LRAGKEHKKPLIPTGHARVPRTVSHHHIRLMFQEKSDDLIPTEVPFQSFPHIWFVEKSTYPQSNMAMGNYGNSHPVTIYINGYKWQNHINEW
jgi:hypothetical protein